MLETPPAWGATPLRALEAGEAANADGVPLSRANDAGTIAALLGVKSLDELHQARELDGASA